MRSGSRPLPAGMKPRRLVYLRHNPTKMMILGLFRARRDGAA
jgi:hypothetical protein